MPSDSGSTASLNQATTLPDFLPKNSTPFPPITRGRFWKWYVQLMIGCGSMTSSCMGLVPTVDDK